MVLKNQKHIEFSSKVFITLFAGSIILFPGVQRGVAASFGIHSSYNNMEVTEKDEVESFMGAGGYTDKNEMRFSFWYFGLFYDSNIAHDSAFNYRLNLSFGYGRLKEHWTTDNTAAPVSERDSSRQAYRKFEQFLRIGYG